VFQKAKLRTRATQHPRKDISPLFLLKMYRHEEKRIERMISKVVGVETKKEGMEKRQRKLPL
jgi:hypothetical protein